MNKILLYLIMILAAIILFSSLFWFYETRFIIGRASVSTATFSIENSYIFISPLRAKAGAQEKIRLTTFILNNQGLGVSGKQVVLDQNPNIIIEPIQSMTDNFGKAVFDISATKIGEYYLSVKVDGSELRQKARLTFD